MTRWNDKVALNIYNFFTFAKTGINLERREYLRSSPSDSSLQAVNHSLPFSFRTDWISIHMPYVIFL